MPSKPEIGFGPEVLFGEITIDLLEARFAPSWLDCWWEGLVIARKRSTGQPGPLLRRADKPEEWT
jgi:hypothetical protein